MKKAFQSLLLTSGLGGVVFLAVYFWPVHADRTLSLAMFDEVAQPGETLRISAVLLDADGKGAAGFTVQFFGPPAINQQAITNANGQATIEAKAPADAAELFKLKLTCQGDRRHMPTEAIGTLFVWPKETPIVVIAEVASLATMLNARDKLGSSPRFLYLCPADNLTDVSAVKAALQHASLPMGPVLAAPRLGKGDAANARRAAMSNLIERYPKIACVVVGDLEAVKHYLPAPCPVYAIGDPAKETAPTGVTLFKNWEELRLKLGP